MPPLSPDDSSSGIRTVLATPTSPRRQMASPLDRERIKLLAHDLVDPFSGNVFREPVIASDGETYEKEHLQRWLAQSGPIPMSPRTRKPMKPGYREDVHTRARLSTLRALFPDDVADEAVALAATEAARLQSEDERRLGGHDEELRVGSALDWGASQPTSQPPPRTEPSWKTDVRNLQREIDEALLDEPYVKSEAGSPLGQYLDDRMRESEIAAVQMERDEAIIARRRAEDAAAFEVERARRCEEELVLTTRRLAADADMATSRAMAKADRDVVEARQAAQMMADERETALRRQMEDREADVKRQLQNAVLEREQRHSQNAGKGIF